MGVSVAVQADCAGYLMERLTGVEDQEVRSLTGQMVGDSEPRLTAADDDGVEGV